MPGEGLLEIRFFGKREEIPGRAGRRPHNLQGGVDIVLVEDAAQGLERNPP
jgi:hypothetical protein